jgi:hypothetical protein
VALPVPIPGLVLHYSYLWHEQHRKGWEEGTKDRPCVVVLAVTREDGDMVVTVAPVTHTPPRMAGEAVEIPVATKRRLGLDDGRSWIVVNEANRFRWPGPDLRSIPGKGVGQFDYGVLPLGLFRQVRERFVSGMRAQKLRVTPRE